MLFRGFVLTAQGVQQNSTELPTIPLGPDGKHDLVALGFPQDIYQQIDEAKQLVAKLQLLSGRLVPASSSELARIERDLRSRDALRVI